MRCEVLEKGEQSLIEKEGGKKEKESGQILGEGGGRNQGVRVEGGMEWVG